MDDPAYTSVKVIMLLLVISATGVFLYYTLSNRDGAQTGSVGYFGQYKDFERK
jgi:hypothetical protein